jgi:hypothetical protein
MRRDSSHISSKRETYTRNITPVQLIRYFLLGLLTRLGRMPEDLQNKVELVVYLSKSY